MEESFRSSYECRGRCIPLQPHDGYSRTFEFQRPVGFCRNYNKESEEEERDGVLGVRTETKCDVRFGIYLGGVSLDFH